VKSCSGPPDPGSWPCVGVSLIRRRGSSGSSGPSDCPVRDRSYRLAGVDPSAFRLVVARVDGDTIATGLAFDLGDDCGIYNVSTVRARAPASARRSPRRLVHDAAERRCCTASLGRRRWRSASTRRRASETSGASSNTPPSPERATRRAANPTSVAGSTLRPGGTEAHRRRGRRLEQRRETASTGTCCGGGGGARSVVGGSWRCASPPRTWGGRDSQTRTCGGADPRLVTASERSGRASPPWR